jgi:hypothetical protein
MPLDQFVEETWKELNGTKEDIFIGTIGGTPQEQLLELAQKRKEATDRLSLILKSIH